MNDLNVMLVQCDLVWENPAQNRRNIEELLDHTDQQADLIVLPEMFTTAFTMVPHQVAEKYSHDMETLNWMKKVATNKRATIMGSVAVEEGGQFFNRMLVVDSSGLVTSYDKRHLFSLSNEHEFYSPGSSHGDFQLKGWNIRPRICYDLRFPEWARNTLVGGEPSYDLIIYSANWPEPRIEQWKSLLSARAIENQAYCIGVNRTGEDLNGFKFNGQSAAYNFKGEQLNNPCLI